MAAPTKHARRLTPLVPLACALLFAVGCKTGPSEKAPDTPPAAASGAEAEPGASAGVDAEAQAAFDRIAASQRAGYERGELAAYMSTWHPESRMVMALADAPETDYIVMSRAQLEAVRAIRFCRLQYQAPLGLELLGSRKDGEHLILDVLSTPPNTNERVQERYVLAKHDGQWQILENRYWVMTIDAGEAQAGVSLDAAHYAKARAELKALPASDLQGRFNLAMGSLMWVQAREAGHQLYAGVVDGASTDENFLSGYVTALLFTGDANTAIKILDRRFDQSDEDASAAVAALAEACG